MQAFWVHGLLSLHWPFWVHWLPQLLTALYLQAPVVGSQLSMVQTLLSSQMVGVAWHLPPLQASPLVHG